MSTEIIIAILGLFGTGSSVLWIFYWRENKKLKNSEVKAAEHQNDSSFVENVDKAVIVYKEALEFQKAQISEIEKFHNGRYDRITETIRLYKLQVDEFRSDSDNNRNALRTLTKKVQLLEKKINDDKHLICHNMLCAIRQPEKI